MQHWRRFGLVLLLCLALGSGAAVGFLYTPDLDAGPLEARYGGPPSRFVEIDGARIHIRDQGPRDAPALLLVHGLGRSLHDWEPCARILAAHYRVVSLDLPGHGLTGPWQRGDYSIQAYADLVGKVATAAGIERFAIGGHSMGGMVAWWGAAQAWPLRVTGLILVDASGYPGDDARRPGLRIARLPLIGDAYSKLRPPFLIERGFRSSFADPAALADDVVQAHLALARRAGNRAALLHRARHFTPPDPELIRLVRVPTLIVWGDGDRLVGVSDGRRFNQEIPGSRLVIVENAGHNPMQEQSTATAGEVASFIATISVR